MVPKALYKGSHLPIHVHICTRMGGCSQWNQIRVSILLKDSLTWAQGLKIGPTTGHVNCFVSVLLPCNFEGGPKTLQDQSTEQPSAD